VYLILSFGSDGRTLSLPDKKHYYPILVFTLIVVIRNNFGSRGNAEHFQGYREGQLGGLKDTISISFFVLKCNLRSSFVTVFSGYVHFSNYPLTDTTPIRRIEDRKQYLAQKAPGEDLLRTQYLKFLHRI